MPGERAIWGMGAVTRMADRGWAGLLTAAAAGDELAFEPLRIGSSEVMERCYHTGLMEIAHMRLLIEYACFRFC